MTIVAKPVVDKQYWILKQGNRKIGALEADTDGYMLRIEDQVQKFKTIPMVRKSLDIAFEPAEKTTPIKLRQVYGYDTTCRAYNPIWDLKHKLPLFTKEKKSKSWYAAGWYTVKQHRSWKIVQNPKLILLERYQYQGPFHSQDLAQQNING
jgi:hypothetical protein